jgi:cysteine dioxygenase
MIQDLVRLIRHVDSLTGPADRETILTLLQDSPVRPQDMIEACKFDHVRYARNVLAKSQWYELVVICWRSGQSSPIHDHLGTVCGVRVVDGIATETTYREVGGNRVHAVARREFGPGNVLISCDTDIHLITNEVADRGLITLHLYSPALTMRYFQEEGAWDDS